MCLDVAVDDFPRSFNRAKLDLLAGSVTELDPALALARSVGK
jgi:hypothetical protein